MLVASWPVNSVKEERGKGWCECSCGSTQESSWKCELEQTLSVVVVKQQRSRPDELFIR